MIFRAKLTSCRSVLLLFTIGLLFLTVNIILVWNQQQPSSQNICVCEPSINMPPHDTAKEKPSSDQQPVSVSEETDSPSTTVSTTTPSNTNKNSHQLAVVVPFRDRYEEMMQFVPHIHKFLNRQNIHHKILVINQADKHR